MIHPCDMLALRLDSKRWGLYNGVLMELVTVDEGGLLLSVDVRGKGCFV